MPFFARPNLSDEQFKQLDGSDNILTLSGQTRIATVSGLTLTNGSGGYVPITLSGASSITNNYVLTYRDDIKKVVLRSGGTGGGGGIYPYNESATTTVGGLPSGTNLYNVQVVDILQEILVPTITPTTTNPSATFGLTITPTLSIPLVREVGATIMVTGTSYFNRGSVSPLYYGTCCFRSGLPTSFGYFENSPVGTNVSTISPDKYVFGSYLVKLNSNYFGSKVYYSSGETPIYRSNGTVVTGVTGTLPSGCTPSTNVYNCSIITGTYPWYWGTGTTAPTIGQTLLDSYVCKCVASSSGSITVDNFNAAGQYIWFATPAASPERLCWQDAVLSSNNGFIPGVLWAAPQLYSVKSPENCWGVPAATVSPSPVSYRFYVSNYATSVSSGMIISKCN